MMTLTLPALLGVSTISEPVWIDGESKEMIAILSIMKYLQLFNWAIDGGKWMNEWMNEWMVF